MGALPLQTAVAWHARAANSPPATTPFAQAGRTLMQLAAAPGLSGPPALPLQTVVAWHAALARSPPALWTRTNRGAPTHTLPAHPTIVTDQVPQGICTSHGGTGIRVYFNGLDNTGTLEERLAKCAAGCRGGVIKSWDETQTWSSRGAAVTFSMAVNPDEWQGRCYCNHVKDEDCTQWEHGNFHRYALPTC